MSITDTTITNMMGIVLTFKMNHSQYLGFRTIKKIVEILAMILS